MIGRISAFTLALLLSAVHVEAQPAIHHPDLSESFAERWAWAEEQDSPDGGYWIGYHIDRLMGAQSFIGSFSSYRNRSQRSLNELLGRPNPELSQFNSVRGHSWVNGKGVFSVSSDRTDELLEVKEIGILFHFERGQEAPSEVEVSNLSLAVDLKSRPLYWLDRVDHEQSLARLRSLYDGSSDEEVKEDILMAVGIHDVSPATLSFLVDVFRNESSSELRESSIFWMGQLDTEEALSVLREALERDPSSDVREKAIFSLSQMSREGALDLLITTAKSERDRELRKEAIFWLGQKAAKEAKATIQSAIYDDADVEVQEHAVFALSQMPADEAVPKLIEIASSHPHVEVRKKAIFWLGETGDPRAVDLLISLLK